MFVMAGLILCYRQLPMLAASLRGRVHLDFSVFRSRNHLNLFQQVVGILELLQPHIFLPAYSEGLEDTFHSYFALFKVLDEVSAIQGYLFKLNSSWTQAFKC